LSRLCITILPTGPAKRINIIRSLLAPAALAAFVAASVTEDEVDKEVKGIVQVDIEVL
jgi:hypothetical protein